MKTLITFSLAVLTFFSCSKKADEDHVHPEYANANAVVGSNTLINVDNWILDEDDGFNFSYYSEYTSSALTQDVIDKGAVLIYMRESVTDPWTALPGTAHYFDGTDHLNLSLTYEFSVGGFKIWMDGYSSSGSPNLTVLENLLGDMDVRIVILNSTAKISGIDFNDYNSIQKALSTNE